VGNAVWAKGTKKGSLRGGQAGKEHKNTLKLINRYRIQDGALSYKLVYKPLSPPLTIDISTVNCCKATYKATERYLGGPILQYRKLGS